MHSTTHRLAAVSLVILTGILAGAQLGKIAPVILWYRDEIGLSLQGAGWLTALLGLFVAIAALPTGLAIGRMGAVRATGYGSLLLVVGGLALAVLASPVAIFGARLVEAVGYLVVCISLPAILNEISPPRWKGPVLAIWSGFVPLGYATADLLAAVLVPLGGVPVFLAVLTLLYALLWLASRLTLRGVRQDAGPAVTGQRGSALTLPVLLIAAGFGLFVILSVAFFTFLPSYALQGTLLVPAGIIALTVPLGNVLASFLVRDRNAGFMAALGIGGFALCALAAPLAFGNEAGAMTTAAAILLTVAGAVVASSLFAAIPFVTPPGGSVATALGTVSQAGGIGTLVGPPIAAWVLESQGWLGFGWFLSLIALLGIFCLAPLAVSALRRTA
ncbi:MAG: MFS transporter [Mesorhizobium sp.]|nr:MFS transporter [Mesorhizobium sp.]